jgi:hypothetical protein
MPNVLDEVQGRIDTAQTSIAKTRKFVDVLGGVAMGLGVLWAIWAATRPAKAAEAKPSEQT